MSSDRLPAALIIACLWLTVAWGAPTDTRPSTSSSSSSASMEANMLEKLRNPCGSRGSGTGTGTDSDSDTLFSNAFFHAISASTSLNATLERDELDQSNCENNNYTNLRDRRPIILPAMTREDKLKAFYKSLVFHIAYMYVVAKGNTEANLTSFYGRCTSDLQNLQCCLKSASNITDEELAATLTEVASISTEAESSDSLRIQRDCLVVRLTAQLLNELTPLLR